MATQAEIAVLRGTATQVKNESQVGGNTAGRVGGLFEGIVDALPSDEAIDGKISEAVADIQPIVIEGDVDNAPDQEDLTSVNQGGTDVLKFKDKTYAPALFSGLGRVYLRKNVVTPENLGYAINLLTAEMVSQPNTIYHIQYNYDLNGETITLPTGCVLEFDGGSVKNGVINGAKMDTAAIYTPEMFGAGTTDDDTQAIQNALNVCRVVKMDGDYHVKSGSAVVTATYPYNNTALDIPSDTEIILNGSISLTTQNHTQYAILNCSYRSNIYLHGTGSIIGDNDTNASTTGEWGMGIAMRCCENVTIDGLDIGKCWGDGIYMQYSAPYNNNIVITNTHIHHCRRQGISLTAGDNVTISNFYIHDISGTAPSSGIDIENETGQDYGVGNIIIKDGSVQDCVVGIVCNGNTHSAKSIILSNVETNSPIVSGVNSSITSCSGTETYISVAPDCMIASCDFGYLSVGSATSIDGIAKVYDSHFTGLSVPSGSNKVVRIVGCTFDIYNFDDGDNYDPRHLYCTGANADVSLSGCKIIVHSYGRYFNAYYLKFSQCDITLPSTQVCSGSTFTKTHLTLDGTVTSGYIYGNTNAIIFTECVIDIPNASVANGKVFRSLNSGKITLINSLVRTNIPNPRSSFFAGSAADLNDFATQYTSLANEKVFSPYEKAWEIVSVPSGTTTLEPADCKTYYFTASVADLSVTLPAPNTSRQINFSFSTGANASVKFSSTNAVMYDENYSIEANKSYEITAISNGVRWAVIANAVDRLKGSDFLCMEAVEAGTITLTIPAVIDTTFLTEMSYKVGDNGTWVTTPNSSSIVTITTPSLAIGDKVYWKGVGSATGKEGGTAKYSFFSSDGKFNLSGNILSLLFGEYYPDENISKNCAFDSIFKGAKVVDASQLKLPSVLTNTCFEHMFQNCTSLTRMPELPATQLKAECYAYMFQGCNHLTETTVLPAAELLVNCYVSMFRNCTQLAKITALFTTTPTTTYTNNWVTNVKATGVFVKSADAQWTDVGVYAVPSGWTIETYSE